VRSCASYRSIQGPLDVETEALDEGDDAYDPIEFAEEDHEF
jgi:hypothetical protein